jgi:hypothetical protein
MGSPGNAGTVVATPTLATAATPVAKGNVRQQWMCAMIVFEVRPPNVRWTPSVLAVGSSTTVPDPVAGDPVAGTSSACVRLTVKVIGLA